MSRPRNNFMRIRQAQNTELEPMKMLSKMDKNQYLLLDFGDEKHIKIIEKADPNQSDEETQQIGNNYIGGLNNFSNDTYKMLQYLSESKALNQSKRNIEDLIKMRIQRIRQKKRNEKGLQRRKIKNYSLNANSAQNQSQPIVFPENPNELEEYLETAHNDALLYKLKRGQQQLQKSLSSAGYYKKMVRNQSLETKINKKSDLKLPGIKLPRGLDKFF